MRSQKLSWDGAPIIIGLGAIIGVYCRYRLSQTITMPNGFPLATLLINLFGCAAIGVTHVLLPLHSRIRLFVVVGVLGGFTTFSTFTYETLVLLRSGRVGEAMLYQIVSVGGGVVAVALSMLATVHVQRLRRGKGEYL